MSDLLVSVDVGTTHLKVGLYDTGGHQVSLAQRACETNYLPDRRAEIDPAHWWRAFEGAFAEALASVDTKAVRAIAISSQAQTYVLLDADGEPVGPAVSWLDARGDADGTATALAGEGYYAHTGWPAPSPLLTSCKLRAMPEAEWDGVGKIVFAEGYLLHKLAGRAAVNANVAAMSGLYSLQQDDWWPAALDAARVPRQILPDLVPVGECVGALHANLAARWGLGDVAVIAGANDQTAAAIGAGLFGPDQVSLGIGTALVAYQVASTDASPLPSRPHWGRYPSGGRYRLGVSSTACAVLEWARDCFAPGVTWEAFYDEALSAPPGCEGLRLNPDFAGEATGSGALLGLCLAHTRAHVFRTALEGIACLARMHLDDFEAHGTIRVTGGGAINESWTQLLADLTGRRLECLDEPQATLRGTAILAGCGTGVFDDLSETIRNLQPRGRVHDPCPAMQAAYDRVYADFERLRCLRRKH